MSGGVLWSIEIAQRTAQWTAAVMHTCTLSPVVRVILHTAAEETEPASREDDATLNEQSLPSQPVHQGNCCCGSFARHAGVAAPFASIGLAFASDTASITLMEIVDNAIMLVIPGAMDAGLTSALFWLSLAFSLVVAGIAAFPLNRWLISRGSCGRPSISLSPAEVVAAT